MTQEELFGDVAERALAPLASIGPHAATNIYNDGNPRKLAWRFQEMLGCAANLALQAQAVYQVAQKFEEHENFDWAYLSVAVRLLDAALKRVVSLVDAIPH